MNKITCHALSDLHGYKPKLPGGDLLILAGDHTAHDLFPEWKQFFDWLASLDYEKKILIGGNHDNFMAITMPKGQAEVDEWNQVNDAIDVMQGTDLSNDFTYLCDSGTEFKNMKIWGSPYTALFYNQNPSAMAFSIPENELKDHFDLIPDDIDILITHTPPYGILDRAQHHRYGSSALKTALDRVQPRYHFFAHLHRDGMRNELVGATNCFNCAFVDEAYQPRDKWHEVII